MLNTIKHNSYCFPVKFAQLKDGLNIAYMDEGSGSNTILFIHGLASYAPAFNLNLPALKNKFRVIAIDLPGYGLSSKLSHSGKMTYYSSIISEFIDILGIKKVTVVGHSMGGHIAMTLALEYPAIVEKLILITPAGIETFTEREAKWLKETLTLEYFANAELKQIEINYRMNFHNWQESAEFMVRDRVALRSQPHFMDYCHNVQHSLHGMLDELVIDRLSEIKIPVLVIIAENDKLIPNLFLHAKMKTSDIAETTRKSFNKGHTVVVPECGHFLQFEKPEVFNSLVINFEIFF